MSFVKFLSLIRLALPAGGPAYMEIQPTRHAGENRHPEDSSKTFDPGFRPGFHRGDAPE